MNSKLLIPVLVSCFATTMAADFEFEQLKKRVAVLEAAVARCCPAYGDLYREQLRKRGQQILTPIAERVRTSLDDFAQSIERQRLQNITLEELIAAGVDRADITPEKLQQVGINIATAIRNIKDAGGFARLGINPNKWQQFKGALAERIGIPLAEALEEQEEEPEVDVTFYISPEMQERLDDAYLNYYNQYYGTYGGGQIPVGIY